MQTVTTSQLGKRYGQKGKALYRMRRQLQRLGVLGNAEKGRQTYPLKKRDEYYGTLNTVGAVIWAYKQAFCKTTVLAAIEDAASRVFELYEEMEEWASGVEQVGGLDQTDLCRMVREAADELGDGSDTLEMLDLGVFKEYDATIWPEPPYDTFLLRGRAQYIGRGKQLANTIHNLRVAAGTLREMAGSVEDLLHDSEPGDDVEGLERDKERLEELAGEVEEAADDLDCVDFPSMYG